MDSRNRYSSSVHTRELAKCRKSPIGVHHWVQSIEDSPIFFCIYCEGFRAFNIKAYRFNPYRGEEFMQVFTLDTLPKLSMLLDKRHKDPSIEDHPLSRDPESYKRGSARKKETKQKGEFDDGPRTSEKKYRRTVRNGVMEFL